ncbi:hypothetical protein AQ1_00854 [alpha proteobacterium Q-1]|nr:hypothetical protein AQ1_00854 [alpha proteobacterium Q-1]
MAIPANDCEAGLGKTLLRPDDMHNPLPDIIDIIDFVAPFFGIAAQNLDLCARQGIFNRQAAIRGGDIMIGNRQSRIGATHPIAIGLQLFKSLRAGDFMHQMPVDIDQARSIANIGNQMPTPYLVIKRQSLRHDPPPSTAICDISCAYRDERHLAIKKRMLLRTRFILLIGRGRIDWRSAGLRGPIT